MDMFQKSGKVLRKILITEKSKVFAVKFFLLLSCINAQVDQRFDLYDWEILGYNESINSISEGYQYVFFATNSNGILRYNKFSRLFDKNLYNGQGIKSQKINHIYFDKNTGILWLVGDGGMEFSNSREGNWNQIDFKRLGIKSLKSIEDFGSSNSFLWIKTSSNYIKLDHISGIVLGTFAYPDEKNIDWGDFNFKNNQFSRNFSFNDYFIQDGWLLGEKDAADNNGIFYKYVSYLESESGISWVGLSNGQLLLIDNFTRSITPISSGIGMALPLTITSNDLIWIGGISSINNSSISSISKNFKEIKNFKSSNYSNFSEVDFFSSKLIDNDIWFGSEGSVIIYNKKSDFFRSIGYEKGVPTQRIEFIEHLDNRVYIASRNDLIVLDKKTKKIINSKISDLINKNNSFINDLVVIDEKIYISLNGRVFIFDKDENVNIDKFKPFFNNSFRIKEIFGSNDILFFSSEKGILNSLNNELIPSSQYFNYRVNDINYIDGILFIGTNGGLAVYDFENKKLNNFYNFSFIKNIFEMEQIDEFLVLLSNAGLIKLRLPL